MPTDNDRKLVHTRQITCRAFRLKNGFLEIETTVTDEKGQEVPFRSRPPVLVGEFMHRMSLTLTIDDDYVIRDVKARTLKAPWPMCGGTDEAYRGLIGLRIGAGFSQKVREILGGVQGCTHVTELVTQAANTYMQASWPDRISRQIAIDPDPRNWPGNRTPAFVNQCHAWRQDGDTMLHEYPELIPPKKQT
ncbi:MAG: DUF2889 domain-containing protein [Sulfuritalea sp.]|nr:DUF2889 domain-containing protein [Sulfuritalea sp.]